MNLISVLLGIIGLVFCLAGLFPVLGWIEWIALIISMFGAVIGIFAQKKTGLSLNLLVVFIAIFRLMLGGGVI